MCKRVEKDPVPNAISAEGVGGEEAFKTPQCSMDTVSAAPVPTLGGQWPEDWWGWPGPPPRLCPLSSLWAAPGHSLPFLKTVGLKRKKLFCCFGLFHLGGGLSTVVAPWQVGS